VGVVLGRVSTWGSGASAGSLSTSDGTSECAWAICCLDQARVGTLCTPLLVPVDDDDSKCGPYICNPSDTPREWSGGIPRREYGLRHVRLVTASTVHVCDESDTNESDNPRECNYHTHPTRCVLNPSAPTMLPRRKAPLLRWSARVFRRPWKRRRGSPRRTRTAATRRRITRTISCTGRSSRRTSTGQW
jgi:hypothetical protein